MIEIKEKRYYIVHINYSVNAAYIFRYDRTRVFTTKQAWNFIYDKKNSDSICYRQSINNRNIREITDDVEKEYFSIFNLDDTKIIVLTTNVVSDKKGNDIICYTAAEKKYEEELEFLLDENYAYSSENVNIVDVNSFSELEQEEKDKALYKEVLRYDYKEDRMNRKYEIVVVDLETTGFDFYKDEILQVSIIDQDENVLLNEYCKPEKNNTWPEAEAVNGISPDMVKDKKPFEFYSKKIEEIINNAKLVLIYNAKFDFNFLRAKGLDLHCKVRDVMLEFAEVFGDFNEYFGNYKWQKLITAAEYYNYNFKAHDSLEDVKATLFVHKKMEELDKDKFNKHIIDTQIIPDDDGETPF